MAPPQQLQKAYLETETGVRISCMFNPAKLSFTASNSWETDQVPGRGAPRARFAGTRSGSFDLSLVFDTTDTGKPVTTHTGKLPKLLDIDTSLPSYDNSRNTGRPPWVKFHWGTHLHTFKAVITSLTITYTYFSPTGVPLRANVEAKLQQFEADRTWARQNPTSGTPSPHRTHQVSVGETLDRIAATEYGDPTLWRIIADANAIRDPFDLAPGSLLAIPERQ